MKILITGGASGLGEAIVKKLAQNNNNTVFFTFNKSEENALKIVTQFPNAFSWHCDFSNEQSLTDLLNKIKEASIDVLINNAFANKFNDHFHKIEPSVFAKSFEINVIPTLRITQEVIKIFRKKKEGKIITVISSSVINKPPIGMSEYAANKAYMLSMSKSWAAENIRFKISSNCISPSFMCTNLTDDTDERVLEQIIDSHPLKKLLTVNEVAEAAVFFVNASPQINGINLIINAGSDVI